MLFLIGRHQPLINPKPVNTMSKATVMVALFAATTTGYNLPLRARATPPPERGVLVGASVCALASYGLSAVHVPERTDMLARAGILGQDEAFASFWESGLDHVHDNGVAILPCARRPFELRPGRRALTLLCSLPSDLRSCTC